MYARACDDILAYASKKRRKLQSQSFLSLPLFAFGNFFLFFRGNEKISFMKFREKKVEKHSEGAEQNSTKTLLSLSLTPVSLLRVLNRTQQRYIII